MPKIKTKRAYDTPEPSDGFRILVDRLWPRGLTHERLDCQLWAKDIAPSTELRQWFHADIPARWSDFEKRYEAELRGSDAFRQFLAEVSRHPAVTFVYASRDEEHNEATVLRTLCTTLIDKDA